jgi:hypothetical protein
MTERDENEKKSFSPRMLEVCVFEKRKSGKEKEAFC